MSCAVVLLLAFSTSQPPPTTAGPPLFPAQPVPAPVGLGPEPIEINQPRGVEVPQHDVTGADSKDLEDAVSGKTNGVGPVQGFAFGGFLLLVGCAAVFALAMFVVQVLALVYVYRDAQARGVEPLLWLAVVFFTHLIGFVVWMCVRPPLLKT